MRPMRVLIVDDTPQVRQGLRTLLPLACQAAGLLLEIVGEAGDGKEAIQQASALRPDVVLMDLELPELDGYAATRAIRGREQGQGVHTRIVAMTANVLPGDREKCLSAGMDDYITKPIRAGALYAALEGPASHG